MSRNRVLLVIQDDGFPGDTRARNEVRTLRDAGYRVSVIAPSFGGQQAKVDGVPVYRFRSTKRANGKLGYLIEYAYSMMAILLLSLWVRVRRGFNVIHLHNPPDTLFLIGLVHKLTGVRILYDLNDLAPEVYVSRFGARSGSLLHRVLLFFERKSARYADLVVTVSDSCVDLISERDRIPRSKIVNVPNAPDLARFASLDLPAERPNDGVLRIGYVGVVGPQEGVDTLLLAVRRLCDEMGESQVRCTIIGDGIIDQLRQQARSLKLDGVVTFTGRMPWAEAMRVLWESDVCVVPDPSNPLNDRSTMVKALEYMALGRPIVAFALPEMSRSLAGAALFAPPGDTNGFAAALSELARDSEQREALGKAGRAKIEGQLNWETASKELLRAYEVVLGR